MTWLRRYKILNCLKSNFWIAPLASLLFALPFVYFIRQIDGQLGWTLLDFGPDGARALLAAVAGTTLSFVVVTYSFLPYRRAARQRQPYAADPRLSLHRPADEDGGIRRLQAMLESLAGTLPAIRADMIIAELDLLHRTVARSFLEEEDRVLASIADVKGLGSA